VDHVRRVGARPERPRTLLIVLLAGLLLVLGAATVSASAADPAKLPKIGFRMGHWQLQPVEWQHLRLNGGKPMLVKTEGPSDELGIPTRPLGERKSMVYNPTVLAQQGLKRLDSWQQTGARVHLRYARKIREKLDELAIMNRARRWQPHQYERGGHSVGWVNANSHGLVLSFLSRYHKLTGLLRASERPAPASLLPRAQGRPALVHHGDASGHVWFEHWPSGKFVHTLNGHINAPSASTTTGLRQGRRSPGYSRAGRRRSAPAAVGDRACSRGTASAARMARSTTTTRISTSCASSR
jgi:hypothetical protein